MTLVTGANGQLGHDVCEKLKDEGVPFIPTDVDTLDITDENRVPAFFGSHDIDCVIHCAAYTAVDKAESEPEKCRRINEMGTLFLARRASEVGAKFVYVSTDYVFSSSGSEPHETGDEKSPLNTYGETKLAGERAVLRLCKKHFIVRTSWVFGEKNTNFIATMLRLSETRDEVSVVCDQVGSPTYSKHLAALLCEIAKSEKFGVYHATNEGFCSWAELAQEAFRVKNRRTAVKPIPTSDYPTPATRPLNSRLSKRSLDEGGFSRLPDWHEGVEAYLKNVEL